MKCRANKNLVIDYRPKKVFTMASGDFNVCI